MTKRVTSITPPIVEKLMGGYRFSWCAGAEQVLTLTARRVHESTGGIYAEMSAEHFYSDGVIGSQVSPLFDLRVNLSSKRGRDEISKRLIDLHIERQLEESYSLGGYISWPELIEQVAGEIIKREREGEPGVIIEPNEASARHPGYFVEPIITKGVPNIIFGDKGVNKTTLGLVLLGIVQTDTESNPLELNVQQHGHPGILDWESTQELTTYSISRLVLGGTLKAFKLPYLHCEQSLADDMERIGAWIEDNNLDLVLIDSLGQAAGSDRFDSSGKGAALSFFKALRQFNITSLIIAQNSKSEETNRKTIYGSTYFSYYARGIFELKRDNNDTGEDMHLALLHQQSNYSKRCQPMGFLATYTDTSITIMREPVNLAQFLDKLSKVGELLECLKSGAKSVQAISSALDISKDRVSVLCSQQKKLGKVVNISTGMWGLAFNESFTE